MSTDAGSQVGDTARPDLWVEVAKMFAAVGRRPDAVA